MFSDTEYQHKIIQYMHNLEPDLLGPESQLNLLSAGDLEQLI